MTNKVAYYLNIVVVCEEKKRGNYIFYYFIKLYVKIKTEI